MCASWFHAMFSANDCATYRLHRRSGQAGRGAACRVAIHVTGTLPGIADAETATRMHTRKVNEKGHVSMARPCPCCRLTCSVLQGAWLAAMVVYRMILHSMPEAPSVTTFSSSRSSNQSRSWRWPTSRPTRWTRRTSRLCQAIVYIQGRGLTIEALSMQVATNNGGGPPPLGSVSGGPQRAAGMWMCQASQLADAETCGCMWSV